MASTVFVNSPNGTVYAYENVSYWDKTEKKTKHKRKCIGHVDAVSGEIVSNHKNGTSRLPIMYNSVIARFYAVFLISKDRLHQSRHALFSSIRMVAGFIY